MFLAGVVLLWAGGAGCGRGSAPIDYGPGHARVRLLADPPALAPGETLTLGVTFDLEPGWHTYWKGQNDTGFPIEVGLELPEGFTAGDVEWPAPERHESPGDILDHVYHDSVTLLIPVTAPDDLPPGTPVALGAKVDWLACRSECVPGSQELTLELPVVDGPQDLPAPSGETATRVEAARARLPRPIAEAGDRVGWAWEGRSLRIEAPGTHGMAFYPDQESVPVAGLLSSGVTDGQFLVLDPDPNLPGGGDTGELRGVLALFGENTTETVFFSLQLPLPKEATKENDP